MANRQSTQAAGMMRERIILQRRVTEAEQDDMGAVRGGWQNYAGPVWARINPVTGIETMLQERLQPVNQYTVTIRYSTATKCVTVADRAYDPRGNRYFNITYVDNLDERKRFLVLACETGTEVG
jgi:SPP1 family predicted phage head-tail adaptor